MPSVARFWGLFAVLLLGLAACAHAGVVGGTVTVVLKDGKVVTGTLLGVDQDTLTIETADGISSDIPESRVRKAFDASGRQIDLADLGGGSDDSQADNAGQDNAPAMRPRRNGAAVAGTILLISGAVVTAVGVIAAVGGSAEESNATSTYYNSIGYTSSGDWVGYTLPGKPGYYTLTQYDDYYYGAAWVDTGLGIGIVGVACLITGAILDATGHHRPANTGLINLRDGKFAMNVPDVELDPATRGYKTKLATAEF